MFKTVALNLEAISDEEKYNGLYAICTDLNDGVEEILRLNHNRRESEDAFRVLYISSQIISTLRIMTLNMIPGE